MQQIQIPSLYLIPKRPLPSLSPYETDSLSQISPRFRYRSDDSHILPHSDFSASSPISSLSSCSTMLSSPASSPHQQQSATASSISLPAIQSLSLEPSAPIIGSARRRKLKRSYATCLLDDSELDLQASVEQYMYAPVVDPQIGSNSNSSCSNLPRNICLITPPLSRGEIGTGSDDNDRSAWSASPRYRSRELSHGLIDTALFTLESIWTKDATVSGSSIPLRLFISETVRRSRTSCCTLQLALYYLYKIRNIIREHNAQTNHKFSTKTNSSSDLDLLLCGRRSFLTALVISNKFLQDVHFSNKAWGKMSGLPATEIAASEKVILQAMNYELVVKHSTWEKWTMFLTSTADSTAFKTRAHKELQQYAKEPLHTVVYDEDGRRLKQSRLTPIKINHHTPSVPSELSINKASSLPSLSFIRS